MRKILVRGVLVLIGAVGLMVLFGDAARASPRLLGPRTTVVGPSWGAPPPVVLPQPVFTPPRPLFIPPQPLFIPPQPVFTPPQPLFIPPQPVFTAPVVVPAPVSAPGGAVIADASYRGGPSVVAAGGPAGGGAIVRSPLASTVVAAPLVHPVVPFYSPSAIISLPFGPDLIVGPGGFIYNGILFDVVAGRGGFIARGPLGGTVVSGPAGTIISPPLGGGIIIGSPVFWFPIIV